MPEDRDKKIEDELVQEIENTLNGHAPEIMKKLRKHLDDIFGHSKYRTDDEIVEDMEDAMLNPPKSPFHETLSQIRDAPLRPTKMFMDQQTWDDIQKWGKEEP